MKPLNQNHGWTTARVISSAAAMICVLSYFHLATGCVQAQDSKTSSQAASTASANMSASGDAATKKFEDFDPGNFSDPTNITNQWMPMKPGMRWTYEGTTIEDDGTAVPHKIVINITDLTKVIGGVRSVCSWDLDYSDGELVEAELAFFAQDDDGNVWRMGEYPEEYEEGKFLAAPTWIHGFEDARAGIMMQASPKLDTPSYSQGWGPAVNWTDRGKVDQMGAKTKAKAGSYDNVLVIAETSASEPDAQQLKYYAPGVGNVRVGWRGAGEKTKETLELTKHETVDAKGLAEMRAEAMKLEKSGYKNSKNVYAKTPQLEQMMSSAAK